jgi:hypothetical protein
MRLISILITPQDYTVASLPEKARENIESFKRVHPGIEHELFTDSSIRDVLSGHFGTEVSAAYEALKPYAYKADLAKHCLMYLYGGVYADISIYFMSGWAAQLSEGQTADKGKLAVFRDLLVSTTWDTVTGLYSAPPGHKAVAKTIELICENVRNRHYGVTSLCPTGPTVFGKAIALACDAQDLAVGTAAEYRPGPSGKDIVSEPSLCLMFRKNLVAIRRKRGQGSLSELGIADGNEYHRLWLSKDIYVDD